jgi:dUTP pyrophosphatase
MGIKNAGMVGNVLSRKDIGELLLCSPPLVEGMVDQSRQLQPNGIDLTLRSISLFSSQGTIGTEGKRSLSELSPLVFDGLGYVELTQGQYLITFNEIVHLPKNIMALAETRSSLLRCGVTIETAVWDAGYEGRSQSLMVVHNRYGFRLKKDARVIQLIFFRLTGETEGYQGIFQGENL